MLAPVLCALCFRASHDSVLAPQRARGLLGVLSRSCVAHATSLPSVKAALVQSLSSSEFSYPLLLPSLQGKGAFVPLRAGCKVWGCAAQCPRDQRSIRLALTSSAWCLETSFWIDKLCFWHQPPVVELFSEKDQKSEQKGWLPGVAARRPRAPPESKAPGNRQLGTSPAGASEALPQPVPLPHNPFGKEISPNFT